MTATLAAPSAADRPDRSQSVAPGPQLAPVPEPPTFDEPPAADGLIPRQWPYRDARCIPQPEATHAGDAGSNTVRTVRLMHRDPAAWRRQASSAVPAAPAAGGTAADSPRARRTATHTRIVAPAPGEPEDADLQLPPISGVPAAPGPLGAMLANALLEILAGRRDIEQLRPYCAHSMFELLQDLPMLGSGGNPQVLSIWLCRPNDQAAEFSATFRHGPRVRALALRLAAAADAWRLVSVELG